MENTFFVSSTRDAKGLVAGDTSLHIFLKLFKKLSFSLDFFAHFFEFLHNLVAFFNTFFVQIFHAQSCVHVIFPNCLHLWVGHHKIVHREK